MTLSPELLLFFRRFTRYMLPPEPLSTPLSDVPPWDIGGYSCAWGEVRLHASGWGPPVVWIRPAVPAHASDIGAAPLLVLTRRGGIRVTSAVSRSFQDDLVAALKAAGFRAAACRHHVYSDQRRYGDAHCPDTWAASWAPLVSQFPSLASWTGWFSPTHPSFAHLFPRTRSGLFGVSLVKSTRRIAALPLP